MKNLIFTPDGDSNYMVQVQSNDTESVPEPASILGLVTIGAIAAGGALKKKVAA